MLRSLERNAAIGRAAVRAGDTDGNAPTDWPTAFSDALANIMHAADDTAVDFEEALRSARNHHGAEVRAAFAQPSPEARAALDAFVSAASKLSATLEEDESRFAFAGWPEWLPSMEEAAADLSLIRVAGDDRC